MLSSTYSITHALNMVGDVAIEAKIMRKCFFIHFFKKLKFYKEIIKYFEIKNNVCKVRLTYTF